MTIILGILALVLITSLAHMMSHDLQKGVEKGMA
jgi:hypothetical protein